VNYLIIESSFPIDIKWTVGNAPIFELRSYAISVDYELVQSVATSWAQSNNFVLIAEAGQVRGNSSVTAYTASVGIYAYVQFYLPGNLFDTGKVPIFYKGQYFGDVQILSNVHFDVVYFTAYAYIVNNRTVNGSDILADIWFDLRHNRIPPGIRLIAAGNPNYQLGNVIDSIINYLGSQISIYQGQNFNLNTFGEVASFSYGVNGGVAWMSTSLVASPGLQSTFKLNKILVYPNVAALNITQEGGQKLQASIFTSYFNPVLDFSFYISWNQTADINKYIHGDTKKTRSVVENQMHKVIIV